MSVESILGIIVAVAIVAGILALVLMAIVRVVAKVKIGFGKAFLFEAIIFTTYVAVAHGLYYAGLGSEMVFAGRFLANGMLSIYLFGTWIQHPQATKHSPAKPLGYRKAAMVWAVMILVIMALGVGTNLVRWYLGTRP